MIKTILLRLLYSTVYKIGSCLFLSEDLSIMPITILFFKQRKITLKKWSQQKEKITRKKPKFCIKTIFLVYIGNLFD